jgi:anti-anti-sigma regulatory factor
LTRVVESGSVTAIVLDFSDVGFLDARCTAVIVAAWTAAKDRGRELRVRGPRGIPARVFALLGLAWMVEGDAGDR